MSATRSPSARRRPERRARLPRRLRRLLPRTFQGRLTGAFLAVVALTLLLVTAIVINRLDDYFTKQQQADLDQRSRSVDTYVEALAADAAKGSPVVGVDGQVDPAVLQAMSGHALQRFIADRLGQADVEITFGRYVSDGELKRFVPSQGAPILIHLEASPVVGQTQEKDVSWTQVYGAGDIFTPYAVRVSLSNPYTFRATALANVTGLLAAVALFALALSVLVSAGLARRFTEPLRRLTEASRGLAEGDLTRRVPPDEVRAGSSELAELAVQFNAMADRLEESVEIIRRDRDRSRDFLADVSHELRTPLAALRTFNELLREGAADDPEARAEFLESSGQQIERLDWLAQNLLELSKLDSGLVLLDLRPDDLRAAVRSAVEQSGGAAERRGVKVTLHLPDHPVRIRHDPQRIGQVVGNLVANAVKFTPRGGSVAVDVTGTSDGARIEVVDTGVGIDATELPHIFERFYAAHRQRSAQQRQRAGSRDRAVDRGHARRDRRGREPGRERISLRGPTLPNDPRLVEENAGDRAGCPSPPRPTVRFGPTCGKLLRPSAPGEPRNPHPEVSTPLLAAVHRPHRGNPPNPCTTTRLPVLPTPAI